MEDAGGIAGRDVTGCLLWSGQAGRGENLGHADGTRDVDTGGSGRASAVGAEGRALLAAAAVVWTPFRIRIHLHQCPRRARRPDQDAEEKHKEAG